VPLTAFVEGVLRTGGRRRASIVLIADGLTQNQIKDMRKAVDDIIQDVIDQLPVSSVRATTAAESFEVFSGL
jgi:hypothetical protein